jgi:Fe-S-cluster containining protein
LNKPSNKNQAEAPSDARSNTIAQALAEATSPAGRAQARTYIEDFGSVVAAGREVFLAYAEAAEQQDDRHTVACQAGCWFCCQIPVAVTVLEAAMVLSAVRRLESDKQQQILLRLEHHVQKQDAALESSEDGTARFRNRCPFLGDNGACSVYEDRPLACRSLLSSDAKRCESWFVDGDAGDPTVSFTLSNNMALIGIPHLMVVFNEGNVDHHPNYDLASSVYALWHEPQRFAQWQQGQPFAQDGFPRMAVESSIYATPDNLQQGPPQE